MTTGLLHDRNLEKQIPKTMGCMTGFLHLFDRNQILTGKRLNTAKRLSSSSSPAFDSASESETNVETPPVSTELAKVNQNTRSASSPDRYSYNYQQYHTANGEAQSPAKMPLPLPVFDIREGTKSAWRFRETTRLSLDSRVVVDANGSLRPRVLGTTNAKVCEDDKRPKSPSVIARLMGLEQLPEPHRDSATMRKSELRRCASESRANHRDINQHTNRFQHFANSKLSTSKLQEQNANVIDYNTTARGIKCEHSSQAKINQRDETNNGFQRKSVQQQQRKSFFPEPKQMHVSIYGEIEKRLRMRGIDEPSRDLETLKRILDALQIKGLLHSKKSLEDQLLQLNRRYESQSIVVMKPSSSPRSKSIRRRQNGIKSPALQRRNLNHRNGDGMTVNSPRVKTASSPSRSESSVTSTTTSVVRRKPLTVDTPRRGTDSLEHHRRVGSPVHSPKIFTRNSHLSSSSPDRTQSPRIRKPTSPIHRKEKLSTRGEDESSSSISTSSVSSQTDSEKRKVEELKDGRILLDRCDKLLHSIAEMNTSELQPSPVSVLDSSFFKDDSSSPSPVLKRSLNFTDRAVDFEDETRSTPISPVLQSNHDQNIDDDDYDYVSDMFRALSYFPKASDLFLLLEKQQYHKGKDTSKACTIQRKIIFDTINEITDRNKSLPPWKAITLTNSGTSALDQIWSEFTKIRERDDSEDLFEVIIRILRKDLDGDAANGWGDCYIEKSEAVLDIERSIYKDLIGETIRDLGTVLVNGRSSVSRRKLVY